MPLIVRSSARNSNLCSPLLRASKTKFQLSINRVKEMLIHFYSQFTIINNPQLRSKLIKSTFIFYLKIIMLEESHPASPVFCQ